MDEEVMKLKIELEPEMSQDHQQKVLDQIDRIGTKYSDVAGEIFFSGDDAKWNALRTLYSADSPDSLQQRHRSGNGRCREGRNPVQACAKRTAGFLR